MVSTVTSSAMAQNTAEADGNVMVALEENSGVSNKPPKPEQNSSIHFF